MRYLKYKISTKFHRLLFLFYFFSILFSISPIQTCPKIMEYFVVFIGRVRDFTNDFWKILKDIFKKMICEIDFFFQNSLVYYLFLYFFIIFDILFSISFICTCQQILEIFIFFLFYGLEILSKNFGKWWNNFLKNIDIWNPKLFINSILYCFF